MEKILNVKFESSSIVACLNVVSLYTSIDNEVIKSIECLIDLDLTVAKF